jgi:hypothetical protein
VADLSWFLNHVGKSGRLRHLSQFLSAVEIPA